ncbi:MAG: hypothetical protein FWG44_08285 [Oscillospiraceae bacterium]|nr:hypothetical protein [Oscillospiraceae bacterium]
MKKSFIINLNFGTWKNQLWFMGDDENSEAFEKAKKNLSAVLPDNDCKNSNDFFNRACAHFESHGFLRIQK